MKPIIYIITCCCFSILSYGQRIQSHESIRQNLVAWDTIRGSWIFDAIHAIHTKQAVPDRTFPEDLTPAELFSLAPVEDRESLQNTLLSINTPDAFTELMNTLYNSSTCETAQGRSFGDPHVVTYDNTGYSFQTV